VSQWHGQISFDGERTWYLDLGSSNGSAVGGVRAVPDVPVLLDGQSEVRIGPLVLRVGRGEDLVTAEPDVTAALPSEHLHVRPTEVDMIGGGVPSDDFDTVVRIENAETAIASDAVARLHYLHSVVGGVEPLRRAYLEAIAEQLEGVPASQRTELFAQLVHELPELSFFPELAGASPPDSIPPGADGLRTSLERVLGSALRTASGEPVADARLAPRVAALMQAFGHGLFELRRVRQQVQRESGIGEPREAQPRDGRDILRYLLDFDTDGEERVRSLVRELSDLATHQTALMKAVQEGARAILDELAPSKLERECGGTRGKHASSLRAWLPGSALRRWSFYRRVHGDLMGGERFVGVLLGPRFAQTYRRATGHSADDGHGVPRTCPAPSSDPARPS
jgi:predicted component of type VI protein secretion system